MVYLLEYHRHAVTGTIYIYLIETKLPDIRQNSPTRQGQKEIQATFTSMNIPD